MTDYLDRTNAMPEYIPYPRFLLKMSLTPTAKLIYTLLLDRYTLSKKNNWQDENGHIYLVYTVDKLAEDMGVGVTAVKRAMTELAAAGLIRRSRRGFSAPSRIYMMIPGDTVLVGQRESKQPVQIAGCENNWKDWLGMHQSSPIQPESVPMENTIQPESVPMENPLIEPESVPMENTIQPESVPMENTLIETENDRHTAALPTLIEPESVPMEATDPTLIEPPRAPSYSRPDDRHTAALPTPNQSNLNHVTFNHLTQTSERAYGEFGNVMLTEAEYAGMKGEYPDVFEAMLDFLSVRVRDNQIPDEPHSAILRRMLE